MFALIAVFLQGCSKTDDADRNSASADIVSATRVSSTSPNSQQDLKANGTTSEQALSTSSASRENIGVKVQDTELTNTQSVISATPSTSENTTSDTREVAGQSTPDTVTLPKEPTLTDAVNNFQKATQRLDASQPENNVYPLPARIAEAAAQLQNMEDLVSKQALEESRKRLMEQQFQRFGLALDEFSTATTEQGRAAPLRQMQEASSEIEGQIR
jgi:hypothetical protein